MEEARILHFPGMALLLLLRSVAATLVPLAGGVRHAIT